MSTRVTRSKQTASALPTKKASRKKKRVSELSSDSESEEVELSSDDQQEFDSDALDDDDASEEESSTKKRKRAPVRKKRAAPSPRKKQKKAAGADSEDENEEEFELKEGQEIVGDVVKAPKTGRVPPGQVSQNTFDFLAHLKDPKCNNRDWFKLHDAVYRVAEKEWRDFVEKFTDLLTEIDTQVPPLPPKDLIHRIYRDIRFSNDKTPYKKCLSASFSRTGRKHVFAGYHISIQPGDLSIVAAGSWCPGKNELAMIRTNIQRSSTRLRRIISSPEFVKHFGEAKPHPKGLRQNVFGHEDELKVAPKGIDKNHKDIDLLKCRSFAVVYHFKDSQVLAPDFQLELTRMVKLLQPLVHCLNDMMTVRAGADEDGSGDEGGDSGSGNEED